MSPFERTAEQLAGFWTAYGDQVVLYGLAAALVTVGVALWRAHRRGRTQQALAVVANIAVLALSAEGMWVVATQRLHLPAAFAVGVFAVSELALVSEAMQASRQYTRDRHPGRHGTAVWVIAAVSGVIVATNAASLTEALLRLALPMAAAGLWWVGLTSDGVVRRQGRWRWTPRRALIALGAITAEEGDLAQINREQTIAAMTRLAQRVHDHQRVAGGGRTGRAGWRSWRAEHRLSRLRRRAREADDEMLAEVARRVRRTARVVELTDPDRVLEAPTLPELAPAPVATWPARLDTAPDMPRDMSPDTTPDTSVDTSVDSGPDTAVDTAARFVGRPELVATRASGQDRAASTRREIARLRRTHPDMTNGAIADQLGVSTKTVQRHLSALRTQRPNVLAPVPVGRTEPAEEPTEAAANEPFEQDEISESIQANRS